MTTCSPQRKRGAGAARHLACALLISVHAAAAHERPAAAMTANAVREVPKFMKSARPAHGQRRLSACDYVTVSGSNYQSSRHGTYQQTGTCEGWPLYTCSDCSSSSTQMIWYHESYGWLIGNTGCETSNAGINIYELDEDLTAVSGTWSEYDGDPYR